MFVLITKSIFIKVFLVIKTIQTKKTKKMKRKKEMIGRILEKVLLIAVWVISIYGAIYLFSMDGTALYLLWWASMFTAFITTMVVGKNIWEYVSDWWDQIFYQSE